ncbi:MAG TPA: DUF222 domain-containing protein [Kofleriaceae bacterium]|nr:DUF222 domain-containing protein [Kofleriaceae bacterium]
MLGYGPKAGHERLRVARELTVLPQLAAALREGQVSFSAVRELSRKVTPATEAAWLAAIHGKCLREIEDLLSGHKKGDRPGDRIDPDLHVRRITLELTPPTMALFRDACRRLEDELGHHLTDDETIAAMCATVLGGVGVATHVAADVDAAELSPRGDESRPSPRGSVVESSRRGDADARAPREDPVADAVGRTRAATPPRIAPYQIALTVCPSCDRGWHDAGGRGIAVPDSTIAQAICDAQYLGDTALTREHGGSNDPSNLICLCFAHHQALHQGKISIMGAAPDALVSDLSAFQCRDSTEVMAPIATA